MNGERAVDAMRRSSSRFETRRHSNGPATAHGAPGERGDAWEELRREIARSRRYGHDFVLIRVPHALSLPVRRSRWPRSRRSEDVARKLRSLVRVLDRVWANNGSVYVLLPESDRPAGERLLARVREAAPELFPDDGVHLAAFPADGLTSGALLAALGKGKENGAGGDVLESANLASLPPREGETDDGRIRLRALTLETSVELTERSMAHAESG